VAGFIGAPRLVEGGRTAIVLMQLIGLIGVIPGTRDSRMQIRVCQVHLHSLAVLATLFSRVAL
jgi:hypothetical protein